MTIDEFNETFLPTLVDELPSIARRLANFPKDRRAAEPLEPCQQGILASWFRVLEEVPIKDACEAIDRFGAWNTPSLDHLAHAVRAEASVIRESRALKLQPQS